MALSFAVLATLFSLGPIFEGPDEIEHYRYVRYLKQNLSLPDPVGQPYGQYHQAPLYYLLLAPFAALLPDSDFEEIDQRRNPYHGYDFQRVGNDNKNVYLHTRAEAFPFTESPTALAVHLMRLISVALGTLTVMTCAAIFRLLWQTPSLVWRRLLALALVAFWAQFVYLSSVLNNDTLAILLVTLALLVVLQQQRYGYTGRRAFLLGLVLGGALLTKATLGLLVFPMALVTLTDRRSWRTAILTAGVTAGVAGWWYVRNSILYGDPTSIGAILQTWPGVTIRDGQIAWDVGLQRAGYAYEGLWARFGHGAVAVGDGLYAFYNLLMIGGLAGLMLRLRRVDRQLVMTLAAFGLIWVGGLLYYSSISNSGNQGRYLLPGIGVYAVALAYGWSAWAELRPNRPVTLGLAGAMAAACAVTLFGYFFPAYQVSPVPEQHQPRIIARYGDTAELIGMSPENPVGQPGETMTIDLYWRALKPADAALQVYFHSAFTPDVIWRDSIPGLGHCPADDWMPGEMWAERYMLHIPEQAPYGTEYLLTAGLYHPQQQAELPAITAAGEPMGPAPVIAILRVERRS